jgi:hypothetical protein
MLHCPCSPSRVIAEHVAEHRGGVAQPTAVPLHQHAAGRGDMLLALLAGFLAAAAAPAAGPAAPPLLNISLVPSCGLVARAGASPACPQPPTPAPTQPPYGGPRAWPWPHGGNATVAGGVALGDIRAVVHAETAGKPLQAQVWWRRRDSHPTLKAVIVTSADDVPLPSTTTHVEADCGVVSFTPPAAGEYFVYYLPYVQTGHYAGTHFHWFNCTDQTNAPSNLCVIDSLAAAAGGGAVGCDSVDAAAAARVLRLESRASPLPLQQPLDFDAFHPMELTATSGELAALRQKSAAPFQVFMEPRENPVRMFNRVPASWGRHGEAHTLSLSAIAGEYLTFQIGLWASGSGGIKNVSLEFEGLAAPTATAGAPPIGAAAFSCFNLGGTDPHGRNFTKEYELASGAVGSLWVGVQLPPSSKTVGRSYASTMTLRVHSVDGDAHSIPLYLTVAVGLGYVCNKKAPRFPVETTLIAKDNASNLGTATHLK